MDDNGQVSAFLNKLWSIVEDPELDDIICWDDVWHFNFCKNIIFK